MRRGKSQRKGRNLGHNLSMLIDMLNLGIIILGSIYSRAAKFLKPTMMDVVTKDTLPRPCSLQNSTNRTG